jgi:hypothetical protein
MRFGSAITGALAVCLPSQSTARNNRLIKQHYDEKEMKNNETY